MKPYRITRRAIEELQEATIYLEDVREGLGDELVDAVFTAIDLICERPLSFPAVGKGVRRAKTKRFKYAIFFINHDDGIVIQSIYHASRRPLGFMEFE